MDRTASVTQSELHIDTAHNLEAISRDFIYILIALEDLPINKAWEL